MYEFLSILVVSVFCAVIVKMLIKDNKNSWEVEIDNKNKIKINKKLNK